MVNILIRGEPVKRRVEEVLKSAGLSVALFLSARQDASCNLTAETGHYVRDKRGRFWEFHSLVEFDGRNFKFTFELDWNGRADEASMLDLHIVECHPNLARNNLKIPPKG